MGKGIRFSAPGIDMRALYAAAILSDPTKAWETHRARKSPFYLLIKGSVKRFIYFAPASMHYRGLREALDLMGHNIFFKEHREVAGAWTYRYTPMEKPQENPLMHFDPVILLLRIVSAMDVISIDLIIRNHEERHHASSRK